MQKANIALVSMPFAFADVPSIGLSLLALLLKDAGFTARLHYFTLALAAQIGMPLYTRISTQPGISCLAGEWIFSGEVFDNTSTDVFDYADNVLRHTSLSDKGDVRKEDEFIEGVLKTRASAKGFLNLCAERVLVDSPSIVGFTSVFQQHLASLALAKLIKRKAPETLIVFGGPNCDDVLGIETIRQFSFVDAIVLGEGEVAFPELVRRFTNGEDFAGIQGVYTQDSLKELTTGQKHYAPTNLVRNMDALPVPMYEDYIEQLNRTALVGQFLPEIPFETSRGCWWGQKHHCTFCGLNDQTIAFRCKTASRVVEDLLELGKRYPGHRLAATDEIISTKYYVELLPELARRNAKLNLFYQIKANVTEQQVRLMHEAGVHSIQPGIESLSTEVLALMRKGVKAIQNVQLLKWCEQYGVTCYWNFLWGFPGERPTVYEEIARILPLLSHLRPPDWMGTIALSRFSPYFESPTEFGITNVRPVKAYRYVYPLPDSVVKNLAYYFDFQYAVAQFPDKYTASTARGITDWRRVHTTSCLFVDEKLDSLVIWDLRPCAVKTVTELTGIEREIYLRCTNATGFRAIASTFPDVSEVEIRAVLNGLVDSMLMIELDGCYLALALTLSEYAHGPTGFESVVRQEKRKMLDSLHERWLVVQ